MAQIDDILKIINGFVQGHQLPKALVIPPNSGFLFYNPITKKIEVAEVKLLAQAICEICNNTTPPIESFKFDSTTKSFDSTTITFDKN